MISYQKVKAEDTHSIQLIAEWYEEEWKIPIETTVQKILNYPDTGIPFQVIMKLGHSPIATGGVYNHVGLLEYDSQYKSYGPWLALIYTKPENRNQGYGALLCKKIEDMSMELGLKEIFLFTFTAESLYKKIGWQEINRLDYKGKDTVVMKKILFP